MIAAQNICVRYGAHTVFNDLSFSLVTGSLTALVGVNGAGKSTLLKAIAGIQSLTGGKVSVDKPFAYLSQLATIQRDMPFSAVETACMGFWPSVGLGGLITKAMRERAIMALHEVGLNGCEARQIGELSGGQFQRLMFARLIIEDAPILLLDEPFAAIDRATVQLLIRLIKEWHQDGKTILCAIHDLDLVAASFPDTLYLDEGYAHYGRTDLVLTSARKEVV